MKWHEFIFSEKKTIRYSRHIIFWLAWWLYFFGSRYFYPKPFLSGQTKLNAPNSSPTKFTRNISSFLDSAEPWTTVEFIRSLFMLTIHIAACYILLYLLLRYLLKAKYVLFLCGAAVLILAMMESSRFVDTTVIPGLIEPNYKMPYYASIFNGMISAIKIMFVAVAIKLGKHWWFKQKEKERLEKEKIDAELQLLKAQIHPEFLLSTLNNINSFALTASPKAPEMLLKLSDILSYMLYECNEAEVPLKKEIKILRDYMALEKMRYGNTLEMNIQIKGDTNTDKIAPFLLLRFVENSFSQSSNSLIEQAWINLEIQIENHVLEMKLMNGKMAESFAEKNGDHNIFDFTEKRLQLIYPARYELKIKEEPEIMIVSLRLQLQGSTQKTEFLEKEITGAIQLKEAFS